MQNTLARHIGLFSLIMYGVGDMVGAGIYGTIGVAAGVMGNAVWLAFVVSMIVALLTGLSYASLGSRFPRAGGASYITKQAYGSDYLSYVVGLSITASGLTSMAAGSNVFAQTLSYFLPGIPLTLLIGAFILLLVGITFAGIKESMTVNLICTLVEVGGLLFVLLVGARYWGSVDYFEMPGGKSLTPVTVLSGAVLTFYAFVGFEDMLNVSEETKNPEKTVPRGIILALAITTLLYIAISITAVSVVPPHHLADPQRGAPLAQITAVSAPWLPTWTYSFITLFAVTNTALLNFVMGSRMIFGMAREKLLPAWFAHIHPTRRTPHRAIIALGSIVLFLATVGNIATLASATSILLLCCFCLVNGALIVLKRGRDYSSAPFEISVIFPMLGLLSCAALILSRLTKFWDDSGPLLIAMSIVGTLSLLYFVRGTVKRQYG